MFVKRSSSFNVTASVAPKLGASGRQSLSSFDFDANEGFLYVAVRAVSASVNGNYDAFSEDVLRESYTTFIDKPVFVNHESGDIERARGVIIDSRLHEDPDDTWVELLMEMDEETFPVLCGFIRNGELDTVSMGCYLTHTTCSVCGNVAYTEADYCDHIKNKGRRYANHDGVLTLAYENCHGVSFYEESWVYVPADDTAMTQAILNEEARVKSGGLAVPLVTDEDTQPCPVCGSGQYDGKSCSVCGYENGSIDKKKTSSHVDNSYSQAIDMKGGRNMSYPHNMDDKIANARRAARARAEMRRDTQRRASVARAKLRRRAQESELDIATNGTIIDVTAPTMTGIPVAPVNELNLNTEAPAISDSPVVARARARARARRRAEMRRRAMFGRRAQEGTVDPLADNTVVDVTAPTMTGIPVAPINELNLPPVTAPIVNDENGANLGGIVPEPSVSAPEYSEPADITTVAKSRAAFVKAHALVELRKELGIERKASDTTMLADKISRESSLLEIRARINELEAIKNAKHASTESPVVAPRRASRAKLISGRRNEDLTSADDLFI